jgi:hypothetical protein
MNAHNVTQGGKSRSTKTVSDPLQRLLDPRVGEKLQQGPCQLVSHFCVQLSGRIADTMT